MVDYFPRPAQKEILKYRSGLMGISAVPGSGKTWTLSLLAAELIKHVSLSADQEILVVTLVNSAVNNFSQRISSFLDSYGLIPSLGYRVRTLHGLAHDILKERPELAGLDAGFQIIDDREAYRLREDAVFRWLSEHSSRISPFLKSDLNENQKKGLLQKSIPDLLSQICLQFIRSAKNAQLSPSIIRYKLEAQSENYPLAEIGLELYELYQRSLDFRGVVDFDDLITKAYQVLMADQSLLTRLQHQWPYILEDEAQDSSQLQQQILGLLSGHDQNGNWVRVGDPNQAIYETFTTADPILFMDYVSQAEHQHLLPNSGRNTKSIIKLANYLVSWTNQSHPNPEARNALFPNWIEPTPPGDQQPNPKDKPDQIHLYTRKLDSDSELRLIASSVSRYLAENPGKTAAVLAPRNARGKTISQVMRTEHNLEPIEMLNSTLSTRKTTGALLRVLIFLQDPISSKKLAAAFAAYYRDLRQDIDSWNSIESISKQLGKLKSPENFLAPEPGKQKDEIFLTLSDVEMDYLVEFQKTARSWLASAVLPVDQQIITIANDLFESDIDLALAHKLSVFVKQTQNRHPDWGLEYLIDELKALARNERKFFSIHNEEIFDPAAHKGKVIITTAHKAKGLEWDRVYLISANNYNFPSGESSDSYIAEKWFIKDALNLPAETLSQLDHLLADNKGNYREGEATLLSRNEYIKERLRLLYVSITRAREELIITWNSGRNGKQVPALPLAALSDYYLGSIKDGD